VPKSVDIFQHDLSFALASFFAVPSDGLKSLLPRLVDVSALPTDAASWLRLQQADPQLVELRYLVENNAMPPGKNYDEPTERALRNQAEHCMLADNDLLCHCSLSLSNKDRAKLRKAGRGDLAERQRLFERMLGNADRLRILVPSGLRAAIVELFHDDAVLGGHRGAEKCWRSALAYFWWPSIKKDFIRYVKQCVPCAEHKGDVARNAIPPQLMLSPRPFDRMHFDFVEGLPASHNGNSVAVVIVDAHSGFGFAIPLKSMDTETLLDAYTQIVLPVTGPTRVWWADNGKSFVANELKQFVRALGSIHCTSSVYNPQSNGVCERYHKTLFEWLAIACQHDQRDWDALLWVQVWLLNTTPNPDGVSPYELVFRHPPALPVESLFTDVLADCALNPAATAMTNRVHRAHELTELFLELNRARKERQYAKRGRPHAEVHEFAVGDAVYFRTDAPAEGDLSEHTRAKWRFGKVIKCHGAGSYDVQSAENDRTVRKLNVRRLKRAGRAIPEHLERLFLPDSDDADIDEFEVDRILKERISDGRREFLLKWKDFTLRAATWEPEPHLRKAPLVMTAWRRANPVPLAIPAAAPAPVPKSSPPTPPTPAQPAPAQPAPAPPATPKVVPSPARTPAVVPAPPAPPPPSSSSRLARQTKPTPGTLGLLARHGRHDD